MKTKLLLLTTTSALALTLASSARADSRFWDFDNWYEGVATNLTLASGQTLWDYQQWYGGNPDTGGYLQLTPPENGRNLAVIFPDIDNGAPVKAFKIRADLRVGNGTNTPPADGFSISYVRDNDVALSNAVNVILDAGFPPYMPPIGRLWGFAGGDSLAQAQDPAGANLPENGTKTGLSICFDAYKGNWLPDGGGPTPGNDVVGITVRADDRTLIQKPLGVAHAGCGETNSMQTGPYDGTGSYAALEWCQLEVEKTVDNKVTVIWKGAKILDNFPLTGYSTHRGRLILAGRTGGLNQNVHFDNIYLETTPAEEATFESLAINADLKGWNFSIKDTGNSKVSRVTQVLWNGADVTTSITTNRVGDVTTGTYTQATRLAPGSRHHVEVTFVTDLSQTLSGEGEAIVAGYYVMPVAYRLPESAVSTATRGIMLGVPWQTEVQNINSSGDNKLNWTEEQLLGLHGENLIASPGPGWTDVIDYQNSSTDEYNAANGNFRQNPGGVTPPLWLGPDYSLQTRLGFGSNPVKNNTDDGTIEWHAYVKFPAAGTYYMVVNSDDGFRLSVARHAKDRMGDIISSVDFGRGNSTGLDAGPIRRIEVDQPGIYPIRGIIFNRGGGFNVEWYTRDGSQLYLVNGTDGLEAWQTATDTGCYVESAIPVRGAVDVLPNRKISIVLANGSTTVNAGSIVLKVDGATVSPAITPGATTLVEQAPIGPQGFWAPGTHTVELTFTDSALTAYSYSWNFRVGAYQFYQGPYAAGGKWNIYMVLRDPLTWWEAEAAARTLVEPLSGQNKPGHLVSIHSHEEADFLRMIAAGQSVWIGLTDSESYGGEETGSDPASSSLVPPGLGNWVWVSGEPYTFARWNGGEPNNAGAGEDAIELYANGLFNDNGIGFGGEPAPIRQFVVEFETQMDTRLADVSYSVLPPGPLPGPDGCNDHFGIRAVRNAGNIPTITAAVQALANPTATVLDTTIPFLNFNDLGGGQGGGGIFGGELPIPGNIAGDDEDVVVVAKARILITETGDYTFGVHSDDGFALRIRGKTWTSVSGAGQLAPGDPGTVVYQYGTGDANTRAVVNLAAGEYDLEFVWFEDGGGAFAELYAAKGAYACDSQANYRLVGFVPTTTGAVGVSAAGWTVEYDAPGGAQLNSIADTEAALVGAPSVAGVSAINYRDPDDQGGAQGCSIAFPQDTPGAADDDFGIRATAQLVIPTTGTYQFGFAGDDGGYLQIEGQTWDRIVSTTDANVGRINGDRIQFDANTGNSRTVGEITLAAGTYTIRALFWERGGGAWFWVFGGLPGESLGALSTNPSATGAGVLFAPCAPLPTISIARNGAGVVITFTGKLLAADKPEGPYTEVMGATSPYPLPASGKARFFRALAP